MSVYTGDKTYAEIKKLAEHYVAIGQLDFYVQHDGFPWGLVDKVEAGSSYRLSIPTSIRVRAVDGDLTFSCSIDIEKREENGTGTANLDRDALRDLAHRLPTNARADLSRLFREKVLPELAERAAEIRLALRRQEDSADVVRGVIALCDKAIELAEARQ